MLEKKARFCLLILAIAMSTGLLVIVLGTVKIAISSFEKPMTESFEGKEIVISPKKAEPFFNTEDIKKVGVKNINGEIDLSATTNGDEINNVTIRGKEDKNINKDNLVEGDLSKFTGEKCIISKRTSEEKSLKINDELELFVAGESKKYKVIAISSNETTFYNRISFYLCPLYFIKIVSIFLFSHRFKGVNPVEFVEFMSKPKLIRAFKNSSKCSS